MLKSGFRGERKGKGTRPQAIGTRREYDGKSKGTSRGAHTQLLLATSEKGKVATEKGINDEGREANDEGKEMVR